DDYAVRGDLEQTQVLAVGTRANLHDRHHALQLPVELEIPLQDDRVGEKCRPVRTEPEIRIAVFQFGRQHHGDAHPGQARNQTVQRFAEILAKSGGERELESGQRIDDDTPGLEPTNRLGQLVLRLVDREIQGPCVDDAHLTLANRLVKPDGTGLRVFARALFEDGNDARFAAPRALPDELCGEDGLPRSRRSGDEDGKTGRNTSAQHLVEAGHPNGQPWRSTLRFRRAAPTSHLRWLEDESREHLNALVSDAKGMQAWNG